MQNLVHVMAGRPVVVTAFLACCLFSIVAARRSRLSAAEEKHYCPNQNMQLSVWLDTQVDQVSRSSNLSNLSNSRPCQGGEGECSKTSSSQGLQIRG